MKHIQAPVNEETKEECFKRHWQRCLFGVGDKVAFKKPKRRRVHGIIVHIEHDTEVMHWSENPMVPKYIGVETKDGLVWTTESKLTFIA